MCRSKLWFFRRLHSCETEHLTANSNTAQLIPDHSDNTSKLSKVKHSHFIWSDLIWSDRSCSLLADGTQHAHAPTHSLPLLITRAFYTAAVVAVVVAIAIAIAVTVISIGTWLSKRTSCTGSFWSHVCSCTVSFEDCA